MDHKPIIALDVSTKEELFQLLEHLPQEALNVKVGMELYYQQGPNVLKELKERGHAVFLDIKLHDIPTTVRKAMAGLATLGVDMVNMHAAGGKEMMEEALKGLEEGAPQGKKRPLLIAVTQLTSTSEEMVREEQGLNLSLEESVLHYAELANDAGADGVVCSAFEAEKIKQRTHKDFLCVTPGIRLKGDAANDQKRVASPDTAKQIGASHIVVGRSITQASDPRVAYNQVLTQWNGGEN